MHPNATAKDDKSKKYPRWVFKAKYPDPHEDKPELEQRLIENEEDEKEIESEGGWADSPSDVGIETAPGAAPDPAILAKRKPPAKTGNPEPKKK